MWPTAVRVLPMFLVFLTGAASLAAQCVEVVPDDEIHCEYHPVLPKNDVVFLSLDDGTLRSARAAFPSETDSQLVLDPFFELGWTPGVSTVSADGERLLVSRTKPSCPRWSGIPGPGLDCSYGRPTLWLAEHYVGDPEDPVDDRWIHTNLTRRLLGRNSEIHGWTTWLHSDLALFNAMVFPDDGGWYCGPPSGCIQEFNAAQMYAVRFSDGEITVEPFAPAAMWRESCLTGRINAQPSIYDDRCFDGQRVAIARRCYDEPDLEHGWAWFNTTNADGTGEMCRADGAVFQVPVLRVFVVELDATCEPMIGSEELVPVRQPPDDPRFRQMGMVPEWGDMMPAISSDGEFVAVATNTGDPDGDLSDNCAGFRLNLRDVEDPMSGASLRWIHVCRLRDDLRCAGEALPVGVEQTPPEASVLPGFVDIAGLAPPSLVYTREWGSSGQARQNDIARVDYGVDHEEPIPLEFGRNAIGAEPIRRTRVGVRRPGRRLIPHQPPSFTGRIAFGECDGFGISQIVVVEADGSNRTVLTEGNAPSWFPSFSPDGTRIAFVREQPTASEIWTMRADGNDLMRLTSSGVSVAPAWSPDGGRIAYSIGELGRAKKIHIMNADGSGDRRLLESSPTEVDEIAPTWSPDGLEIAFGSNRRGRFEIWVADIGGDDLHRITEAYYDDH